MQEKVCNLPSKLFYDYEELVEGVSDTAIYIIFLSV